MTLYVAQSAAAAAVAASVGRYRGVQAMNYGRFPVGAISATNGSPNLVGSGTHFLSQVEVGYFINGFPSGLYTVQSITDDTHLALTANVTDATGTYTCSPDFPVPNNTFTRVPLRGPDVWDTDNFHFTDHSALSGTVTKSSTSTTIVGSGTAFTTQLAVNQVVDVPGGSGIDTLVVKSITDDTHFVAWQTPASSASGQTATKNPDCIAVPTAVTNGASCYFLAYIYQDWDYASGGMREMSLFKNLPSGITPSLTNVATELQGNFSAPVALTGDETADQCILPVKATDGDYFSVFAYQNTGGSVGLTPDFPNGIGGYAYGLGLQLIGT